jgi:hypothetical protein
MPPQEKPSIHLIQCHNFDHHTGRRGQRQKSLAAYTSFSQANLHAKEEAAKIYVKSNKNVSSAPEDISKGGELLKAEIVLNENVPELDVCG